MREGAHAERFFVIERGQATVIRDTPQLASLGPGDFFGEVGLLQGGVRTASVIAATDMRVRVLSRLEFGRAMMNLPALARVVRSVTQARLVGTEPSPA